MSIMWMGACSFNTLILSSSLRGPARSNRCLQIICFPHGSLVSILPSSYKLIFISECSRLQLRHLPIWSFFNLIKELSGRYYLSFNMKELFMISDAGEVQLWCSGPDQCQPGATGRALGHVLLWRKLEEIFHQGAAKRRAQPVEPVMTSSNFTWDSYSLLHLFTPEAVPWGHSPHRSPLWLQETVRAWCIQALQGGPSVVCSNG